MDDSAIVKLYWERDTRAIKETQSKYERYLTKIAYNILKDIEDTEESVNDTYLAAWESIPPQKPSVLSSYLSKLTRRISIDIFRRRTRIKRKASEYELSLSELSDCLPSKESVDAKIDSILLSEAIGRFLKAQSEAARNLFIGRYYFFDPLKEVARYCKVSEANAKTMLYRTRCELKEYLKKEGFSL